MYFLSAFSSSIFVRHVVQCNGSKIRQVSFGTNRCVLGDLNRNFISLILIREGLDIWERSVDPTSRMTLVVPKLGASYVPHQLLTFHLILLLGLLHPFSLTDFFQFDISETQGHFISG